MLFFIFVHQIFVIASCFAPPACRSRCESETPGGDSGSCDSCFAWRALDLIVFVVRALVTSGARSSFCKKVFIWTYMHFPGPDTGFRSGVSARAREMLPVPTPGNIGQFCGFPVAQIFNIFWKFWSHRGNICQSLFNFFGGEPKRNRTEGRRFLCPSPTPWVASVCSVRQKIIVGAITKPTPIVMKALAMWTTSKGNNCPMKSVSGRVCRRAQRQWIARFITLPPIGGSVSAYPIEIGVTPAPRAAHPLARPWKHTRGARVVT